ncbi:helix-turn-helix domain-containing protein [Acidobacteriota bacterium]
MIESDKRKVIYKLHLEGMGIREISRRLKVSRNTVQRIIADKGTMPEITRKDKIEIDPQLLERLHNACNGWRERIYEKLIEEEGIKIGYSTLTRLLRELGIEGKNKKRQRRSTRVPDQPGVEMQHDTSPYRIKINDRLTPVVGSLLYLRYCKMRYLKFYRWFNRFKMKCFFHEALTYFGYTACNCIIDNTNLARLRGSGANAVMVPEMRQFSDKYGFQFVCHEIGHSNRKAGNERSFYTVETNFFPGRRFDSLQDLNQQALEWATKRMAHRPVSKSGLIPARTFEFEQSYLIKLPPYIHPPYRVHYRLIDQYGYVSFDGNFYWIPELSRDRVKVKILEYSNLIKVYHKRKLLVQYSLPSEEVKNERFSPPGQSPKYQPWNRKKPTAFEEKKLRTLSPEVEAYLEFALSGKQTQNQYVKQKHRFIRQLYGLYQKLALPLFVKTINRALNYRITNMETIERIAILQIKEGNYPLSTFIPLTIDIDENFKNRESYLEGYSSDEVDLTLYDQLLEIEEEDEEEDL